MNYATFDDLFRAAMTVPSSKGPGDASPFPYQRAFATAPTLPSLVRAPTGAGKTAMAVLGWLWRRRFHPDAGVRAGTPRRLVFCLPMRTLVEQTLKNTCEWLERLGLADAIAAYQLMGGAVDTAWEDHPEADAILIGTQDQLLSRALNRGYAMSRFRWPVHFALLNNDSLWILDEVQLMGPGLSTSAQLQAFRELIGTQVPSQSVWMSATLAPGRLHTIDLRHRDLPTLELGNDDLASPVLGKRHRAPKPLQPSKAPAGDLTALAREIVTAHVGDSLSLIVVNQVARAQALFAAVRKLAKADVDVALLHSRFRPDDRQRIQDKVLADDWHGILVATQAIEAGVDLSARTLFTEVASWSSLVQRFGRCNRRADYSAAEASVRWIEVADDKLAPYSLDDVAVARAHLAALDDVGPARLAAIPAADETPVLPVIRRRDLLELFDTQPDLAGHDLDISRFIRDSADRDVQVAWRSWDGDKGPEPDIPDLQRGELCSVPIDGLRKLVKDNKDGKLYRWSGLLGRWEAIREPAPGMALLLSTKAGGYDAALGWTADPKQQPAPVAVEAAAPDSDEREHLSYDCDSYVTLTDHSCDVAAEAEALRSELAGDAPWPSIIAAARWHDLGKAHEVFQAMITSGLSTADPRRNGGPWAKSNGTRGKRATRRNFRHELASALAFLAQGASDLEAYLVLAHHGKVRLTIRSRPEEIVPPDGRRFAHGVWDGDVVPPVDLALEAGVTRAVTLDLSLMELGDTASGPSWSDRTSRLVATHGPFRIGYWETLVRIADWRGTARRRRGAGSQIQ